MAESAVSALQESHLASRRRPGEPFGVREASRRAIWRPGERPGEPFGVQEASGSANLAAGRRPGSTRRGMPKNAVLRPTLALQQDEHISACYKLKAVFFE